MSIHLNFFVHLNGRYAVLWPVHMFKTYDNQLELVAIFQAKPLWAWVQSIPAKIGCMDPYALI